MEKHTVTLQEIATYLDMEAPYLKMAFAYFAPELLEPYKELDLEDDSLNDKFIFPDTIETWKLVAFTINNAYIEDMSAAKEEFLKGIDMLGV